MITYNTLYVLAGLMFAAFAVSGAIDRGNGRRFGNAAFWGLLAVVFLVSLPPFWVGLIVLALALIAGLGLTGRAEVGSTSPQERVAGADRWGNWLFAPALLVPVITLAGSFWGKGLVADPKQATLVSLGVGIVLATLLALAMFRPPPAAPLREGRRLMDSVGWAAILPQALAALGAVFLLGKVGDAVGGLATTWLPLGSPFAAACAYCLGMAAFTMIMGNAFAAFPVMTAAIGLPLIVGRFHGDPAVMGALGMLSGFCGTLLTPMAANFNIVPAALLELKDRHAVIRAQAPTALWLLLANLVLMNALVYRL